MPSLSLGALSTESFQSNRTNKWNINEIILNNKSIDGKYCIEKFKILTLLGQLSEFNHQT